MRPLETALACRRSAHRSDEHTLPRAIVPLSTMPTFPDSFSTAQLIPVPGAKPVQSLSA